MCTSYLIYVFLVYLSAASTSQCLPTRDSPRMLHMSMDAFLGKRGIGLVETSGQGSCSNMAILKTVTLPETNIAPEKSWLEC